MTLAAQTSHTEIAPLTPARHDEWDAYIHTAPHATFSHQRAWADLVRDTFNHQPLPLIACRNSRIVGLLPLIAIHSRIFGQALVTSPYLTHGGILADDPTAAAALTHAAIDLAQRRRAHYLELRNHAPAPGPLLNKTKYHTLTIDLTPGEDALWSNALHASARRNIRKARKASLEIISSTHPHNPEHLHAFVNINTHNMRRLGTPAHGQTFFANILQRFPNAQLIMARADNRFVGGMLLVAFRGTMHMPWIASLNQYFDRRPNNLLYWHAIATACHQNCHQLDLGRSKPDSGTWQFKIQHGAQPTPIAYQYHLTRRRTLPDIDPDNKTYAPLIATWKRLPIPLARTLGPRLIAAIP